MVTQLNPQTAPGAVSAPEDEALFSQAPDDQQPDGDGVQPQAGEGEQTPPAAAPATGVGAPVDWEARAKAAEAALLAEKNNTKREQGQTRKAREELQRHLNTPAQRPDPAAQRAEVSAARADTRTQMQLRGATPEEAEQAASLAAGRILQQQQTEHAQTLQQEGQVWVAAMNEAVQVTGQAWTEMPKHVQTMWAKGAQTFDRELMQAAIDAVQAIPPKQGATPTATTGQPAKQRPNTPPVARPAGVGTGMSWDQATKIKNLRDLSDEAYEKLVGG